MDAAQFEAIRADLVAKLKTWSEGSPDLTAAEIAEAFEYMAPDFDHFKALVTDTTGRCFQQKCDIIKNTLLEVVQKLKGQGNISIETKQVMDVLARAIGRLTLHGYNLTDEYAVEMIKRVNKTKELPWETSELGNRPDDDRLQVYIWSVYVQLEFAMSSCGCIQCQVQYPSV